MLSSINQFNFSSDSSAANKRRRLQNSCDGCRRRKIRCDSAEMPNNVCSRCLLSKIECSHNSETKKRGPPKGRVHRVHRQTIQSLVSDILSPLAPYAIPDDTEEVKRIIEDLARHIRNLENKLNALAKAGKSSDTLSSTSSSTLDNLSEQQQQHRDDSSSPFEPLTPNNPSPRSPKLTDDSREESSSHTDVLSQRMKQLSLSQAKGRHFGKSNPLMLVQTAMDIKKEEDEDGLLGDEDPDMEKASEDWKRPQFWNIYPWQVLPEPNLPPLIFPPDDLLLHLVQLFFMHTNLFIPLFHRPSFERCVAERRHLHDRQFGETLLAVCAVASRRSSDKRNLWDGTDFVQSSGWRWYRQLTLFPSSFFEPPSLLLVQKYILCIAFLAATSTPDAGWVLTAIAIRLAQDVGAHRKRKGKPTIEGELWKRAFWILVAMDTFTSTGLGRPSVTRSDEFDLDLPIECDDEYWEHPDPERAFKQPPGKPAACMYWIHMLKLFDVLSFAQRTVYSIRDQPGVSSTERNQKALVEINSALNKWFDSVPDHLKWDPDRESGLYFQQSVALNCNYYWLQIHVHRLFIPRPDETPICTNVPSLAICANAARACSRVIEAAKARGTVTLPNVINAAFSSIIVLLVYVSRAKGTNANVDVKKEMKYIQVCLESLREFEPVSQSSGRYCDILSKVMEINEFGEIAPTLRSSEKRKNNDQSVSQTSMEAGSTSTSRSFNSGQTETNQENLNANPTMYSSYAHDLFTPNFLPYAHDPPLQFSSWSTLPSNDGSSFGSGSTSGPGQMGFGSMASQRAGNDQVVLDNLDLTSGMSMMFGGEGLRASMNGTGVVNHHGSGGGGDWEEYMTNVDELLRFNGFPNQ